MQKIVKFIQDIYKTKEFIPLHRPLFVGNEKKYLNECIDSTYVSSVGEFVDRFETTFASYVGAKYAVAVVNGTSALHLALMVSGVQKEDEVITQALTFVATPNAISYIGAKPIFLDVELDSIGLSPDALKAFLEKNCELRNGCCFNKTTSKIIKACVPMHTLGHSSKIDEIVNICHEWNIRVIEDSAESLGSFYKNKHTGTFGNMGVFSFNGNKIITSGGGGVLVTDDEDLAKKAKHLSTTAKVPHPYEFVHDVVGYNYRMPNLNAALLLAQLENIEVFLKSKRELALKYKRFFEGYVDIKFIEELEESKSNYWLNAIVLKDKEQRDEYLKFLNENGVMSRPLWTLMNDLDIYKNVQTDKLKNSRYLQTRVVNIPSSAI